MKIKNYSSVKIIFLVCYNNKGINSHSRKMFFSAFQTTLRSEPKTPELSGVN